MSAIERALERVNLSEEVKLVQGPVGFSIEEVKLTLEHRTLVIDYVELSQESVESGTEPLWRESERVRCCAEDRVLGSGDRIACAEHAMSLSEPNEAIRFLVMSRSGSVEAITSHPTTMRDSVTVIGWFVAGGSESEMVLIKAVMGCAGSPTSIR